MSVERETSTSTTPSRRELLAVGLPLALLILAFYAFGTERVGLTQDDAGQYFQMAESPAYLARLPYSFRILTPLLAGVWPGGPLEGFTTVTLIALILACVALYAYQRVVGLSRAAAFAGAALFAVSGGAIRMLTTPIYIDAITYLAEATAFGLLATRRYWPFLGVMTLGVLNRETALLLIPLYMVVTPGAWRIGGRAALVVLLPFGMLSGAVLVKLWAGGVLAGATPLSVLAPYARTFRQDMPPLTDLFDLFSTFGVMWLLGLKNLPGPTSFQRRGLVFGALVVLQLIVARGDEGRNLSHLFVLVIPLAMLDVERLVTAGSRRSKLLAVTLVLACAVSMVHARWTLLEPIVLRYSLVAIGSVAALAIIVATRTRCQDDRRLTKDERT